MSGFADGTRTFVPDLVTSTEGLQLNRAFAQIKDAKVRRRIVDLVVQIAESQDRQLPEAASESSA